MPISQILLASTSGPTYTLTTEANNVNEGSALTFNVTTTGVDDGTTLYWSNWNNFDGVGRMDYPTGSLTITSNAGSFSITVATDSTTAVAQQQYSVFLYAGGPGGSGGTLVATVSDIIVNDTSQTPPLVAPFSLEFATGRRLLVSNTQSDWNLGTTWTIEFWSKSAAVSDGDPLTIMSQNPETTCIDIYYQSGYLKMSNGYQLCEEPPINQWTHVAMSSDAGFLSVYYNGIVKFQSQANKSLDNGSQDLFIGRRGNNDFQYFNGKLALIRISNTDNYPAVFVPRYDYEPADAYTKLQLGLVDPYTDGTTVHPISNTGVVSTNDIPREQSLVFNMSSWLTTPASGEWNLGTSWTIEFWMNANAQSSTASGGIWGLLNQHGWDAVDSINVALSDNKLVFLSGSGANDDVRYTEPTVGQWTHVAIVNDTGTQKVFYNGVEQTKVSGTFGSATYANTTDALYIGRLSNQYGSYNGQFNGKLALVRISNTAKYSTTFTPTASYGYEVDTKLLLSGYGPLIDSVGHLITNNGVTVSSSFPQSRFVALQYDLNHGYAANYGGNTVTVLLADYPDIVNVPKGATVVVTGGNNHTLTVTSQPDSFGLVRFIPVNTQSFNTNGSDTLTFTWAG